MVTASLAIGTHGFVVGDEPTLTVPVAEMGCIDCVSHRVPGCGHTCSALPLDAELPSIVATTNAPRALVPSTVLHGLSLKPPLSPPII